MYKCDQYPDSVLVKKKSSASGVLELVAKPVEAFVEAVTSRCYRALDVPFLAPHLIQSQLVGELPRIQSSSKVLFVGINQKDAILELLRVHEMVELLPVLRPLSPDQVPTQLLTHITG